MKLIKLCMALLIVFAFACDGKKNESGEAETATNEGTAEGTDNSDAAGAVTTLRVDTAESVIKWTGKKIGGSHNGEIRLQGGEIMVTNETVSDGSFVINMASLTDKDLTDQESNQKLTGHLKSPDFFDVAKYPTAKFEVTRIDAGKSENEQIVTGNLTMKDKTEEISIPVTIDRNNDGIKAKGKTTIDRTKWDVRYGSGKFFKNLGDKAIYDEVELEFELVAKR